MSDINYRLQLTIALFFHVVITECSHYVSLQGHKVHSVLCQNGHLIQSVICERRAHKHNRNTFA